MFREFEHRASQLVLVVAMFAAGTIPAAAEPWELPRLSREDAPQRPWNWDGKAGVDPYRSKAPTALVPGAAPTPDGSGTGWASVNLPGADLIWQKASIDARIDPTQQAQFGVTVKRPIASAGGVAVTLENSYSVSRRIEAAPSPVTTQSLPTTEPPQSWDAGSAVRLDIIKTSLSVGSSLSSIDNQWRNKVAVERELFNGFSVSSEVTSVGTTSASASAGVGAKYKLKW
jgi:hypothetical protein